MSKIELGSAAAMKPKYVAIEATIVRADGTVEDLGIICDQHYGIFGGVRNLINKVKRGLFKWK